MSDQVTRPVWIVWQNTDLTEGRGREVPIAVCATKSTAARLAKGNGVMGSNANVTGFEAVLHNGRWCAPVAIILPSEADEAKEIAANELRAVVERAKTLGLTMTDLQVIARGIEP